jgi:molybdopterin/thiamine biosynthesis adenylyltransferase
MQITVVGVGALGSHACQFLRSREVTWKLIDMDRVETKNLGSQFHPKTMVGKNKALALSQTLNLLWGLKVQAVPHRLTSDNCAQLLGGSGLVLDCLDNGASRRLVQGWCRSTNTPCLHGALAPEGQLGRVVWDRDFVVDDETAQGAPTCEGADHLPFIALVSSLIAKSVQEWLDTGKQVGYHVVPNGALIRI